MQYQLSKKKEKGKGDEKSPEHLPRVKDRNLKK